MRLLVVVQAPPGIAAPALGQPSRKPIDSVSSHAPGHRCAGPEGRNDQGYVIVAQTYSSVTHGPMVP